MINYGYRIRQNHHRESLRTQVFATALKTTDTWIPSITKRKTNRYCPGEGSPFTLDVVNGLGHRLSLDFCDLGLTKPLVAPLYLP